MTDYSLAMSSGFFGFFAHAGFADALWQSQHGRPTRLSGASSGALVAGSLAAGLHPSDIAQIFLDLKRNDFWDPAVGLGFLRGDAMYEHLRSILPVERIEDCSIPLTISVFNLGRRRTEVLRTGDLARAIQASCAVPFMFHPVRIDGQLYSDGGIADRPGIAGLSDSSQPILYHHLRTSSPWRRKRSKAVLPPQRLGLVCADLGELPRITPYRLSSGREVYELARERSRSFFNSGNASGSR